MTQEAFAKSGESGLATCKDQLFLQKETLFATTRVVLFLRGNSRGDCDMYFFLLWRTDCCFQPSHNALPVRGAYNILQPHAIEWKLCNTTPSSARTSLDRSSNNSNWVPRTCPWMHSVVWPVQLQLKCSASPLQRSPEWQPNGPTDVNLVTESKTIHGHFPNERQGQYINKSTPIYYNICMYMYIYILWCILNDIFFLSLSLTRYNIHYM